MNQFVRLYVWAQSAVRSERGAGMAEYALLVALIAVVVALVLPAFATAISDTFASVTATLNN